MTLPGIWPSFLISPPARPDILVGKDELLASIENCLLNSHSKHAAISGPSGIGKTVLACSISTRAEVINRFRDGILWARQVPHIGIGAILGGWAELFGEDISKTSKVEDRISKVKRILKERRTLIFLDSIVDARIASALSCGGPHSTTILITRDHGLAQEYGNAGAVWQVNGIRGDNAWGILSAYAPSIDWKDYVDADRSQDFPNFNPRDLILIAKSLDTFHTSPIAGFDIEAIIQNILVEGIRGVDLSPDSSIMTRNLGLVEWSLSCLPETTQEVFWNLTAFAPDPDWFSNQAASQVANATSIDLDLLSSCNLITRQEEHLTIHPEMGGSFFSQKQVSGRKKHREYYLDVLNDFSGQPDEISKVYGQGMWACMSNKLEENRRDLVVALSAYQEELGLWEDYRNCGELALQACKTHSLCFEEGQLCNNLGKATHMLGDVQVALSYYQLAEDLLGKEGALSERALVMNNIATILVENGEFEKAQSKLMVAIPLLKDQSGSVVQAYLHNNLGKIFNDLNLPIQARDEYMKALQILEVLPEDELELTVRFNLSLVYSRLGKKIDAVDELQKAVDIEHRIGHPNYYSDVALLEKMKREQNEPRLIHWLRQKFAG